MNRQIFRVWVVFFEQARHDLQKCPVRPETLRFEIDEAFRPDEFAAMNWIIRILVLSLIVGLVLSFLNINPMGILNNTWDTILAVVALFTGIAEWALPYVLVGAIVVVPLALIGALLRYLRR
jgi:hypothetical protein